MDVSLSQTRIDLENVAVFTLVTTGTFYEQALPFLKDVMSSCSKRVQFDEYMQLMRNKNMKYTTAKDTNSPYGTSKDIVLFGEGKMNQKNIKRH